MAGVTVDVVASLEVISGVKASLIDTSLDQGSGNGDGDPLRGGDVRGGITIYLFSQKHILSTCHVPDRHWRSQEIQRRMRQTLPLKFTF